MKKQNKGFTLIELLVVIGIIGVLSALVLANIGKARDKGKIAAFESEMDGIKKAAESYYSNGNTYNGLFSDVSGAANIDLVSVTDPSIQSLLTSITSRTSDTLIYGVVDPGGDAYAVYGRIPASDPASITAADIYCVDNLGHSGPVSVDATSGAGGQLVDTPVSVCW